MIVLDANYILRYLLKDNEEMFNTAKETIESDYCLVLNEVLAEVVYVLLGVYKVPKDIIVQILSEFVQLDNLSMHEDKNVLLNALQTYSTKSLDYVDCYLCALKLRYTVKTFDKKLIKCLNS